MDEIQNCLECEVVQDRVLEHNCEPRNYFEELEDRFKAQEANLFDKTFPILELLFDVFKRNPDLLEYEDKLQTSPGAVLHYFSRINYVEGVKILLKDPFYISPNTKNKHGLSPLWIAAW